MGSFGKRLKRTQKSESESESEMGSEEEQNGFMNEVSSEEDFGGSDQYEDEGEDGVSAEEEGEEEASDDDDEEGEDDGDEQVDEDGEQEEDDADEEEEEEEDDDVGNRKGNRKGDEMEELEKEYRDIQNREQTLIQDLKRNKDEDLLKGQAIKSQKALWDKALEIRFLLQKSFSKSNKLPQEPVRSLFCESDEEVSTAFSNLIESSKKTIDSLLQLQEALVENNTSIAEAAEEGESQSSPRPSGGFDKMDGDHEKTWSQIAQMHSRVAAFRNKAVDRWQRKADVHSGAAAKKAKLLAFNQNISDQVATYMRDPSKMIRSMQMRREAIGVFGYVAPQAANTKEEGNAEGDPELLDDSEFYQQLLKEFFETIDPNASESAFYALKRLQTKKRKAVDRRASKSRKIRYHVHEKIVNFMAPQPMNLPPMAPKLFENLFGLKSQKSQKSSSAA